MEGYKLSQQAARDYREILTFTINEWDVNQFEKYASLLDEAFERLVETPMIGVRRNDIRSGFYQMKQQYNNACLSGCPPIKGIVKQYRFHE